MNLASRCREAISHVAMLKKELAMHQRRAADALALQRQQHQGQLPRTVPNTTQSKVSSEKLVSKTDVAAEMVRMDRLMAAHAPPPPPPPHPPPKDLESPIEEPTTEDGSPKSEFYTDYDEEKKYSSASDDDDEKEEDDELGPEVGFNTKPIFPHSASPRSPDKADDYADEFNEGLLPSGRKKQGVFRPSAPEISEVDSDANSVSSNQSDYRRNIMTNIDAFEASFATNFPESFSSSPTNEETQTPSEIYNPFFPSPRKDPPLSIEPTPAELAMARSAPALPRSFGERVHSLPMRASPPLRAMDNIQASTPSPRSNPSRSVDEIMDEIMPTTPPRSVREVTPSSHRTPDSAARSHSERRDPRTPMSLICRKVSTDEIDEPRRPEKTVSIVARARYEKALQPRGFQPGPRSSSSSSWRDSGSKSEKETSEELDDESLQPEAESLSSKRPGRRRLRSSPPTAPASSKTPSNVMQRLQQRRAKSPSVSTNSTRSSSPRSLKSLFRRSLSPRTTKPGSTSASPKTQPDVATPPEAPSPEPTPPEISSKASTGTTPSVLDVVSRYEQAAKRAERLGTISGSGGRSARPPHRTSFSSPIASRSPSPGCSPSDEEDEGEPRGQTRVASPRAFKSLTRNLSEDDDDVVRGWSDARAAGSARELQTLAKRAAGHEKSSRTRNGATDHMHEVSNNSFSPRNRTYEKSEFKSVDPATYVAQSQRPNAPTSTFIAAARNSRRNNTKPVSYAEPSLNSKLRQGDVFFAKNDSDKRTNGDDMLEADYNTRSVRL